MQKLGNIGEEYDLFAFGEPNRGQFFLCLVFSILRGTQRCLKEIIKAGRSQANGKLH